MRTSQLRRFWRSMSTISMAPQEPMITEIAARNDWKVETKESRNEEKIEGAERDDHGVDDGGCGAGERHAHGEEREARAVDAVMPAEMRLTMMTIENGT